MAIGETVVDYGWPISRATVERHAHPAYPVPQRSADWLRPMLSRDAREFEAYRILGSAWRSPVTTHVQTGRRFDVVDIPADLAADARKHLFQRGSECGAIFAVRGRWHLFVPSDSGDLPWPNAVRYRSGPWVSLPARQARWGLAQDLWWISRPTSGLFTHPITLVATLSALADSPSDAEGESLPLGRKDLPWPAS
ncbi:hypothetical protein ABZX77_14900 [Streptomyces sp. NPDC004237]|uniref:hypothetical protein n=1 Tax=Streptomyces sp. NPDC004237 TaxID=3154455 RepID=UPI0033AC6E25